MKTIFDVGANDGSSCYHFSVNGDLVYAFEPTPFLLQKFLLPKQSSNYIVVPKAVSNFNGKAKFKIAGQHDWGCSSLNSFSENLNQTWIGRTDFVVTEEIDVEVIKLKSFILQEKISCIDFLHVDTQGSDLDVLLGLEEKIIIVNAGVIEAPASEEVKLYQNQYSKEQAEAFLINHGFKIDKLEYQQNEFNIFFSKK